MCERRSAGAGGAVEHGAVDAGFGEVGVVVRLRSLTA